MIQTANELRDIVNQVLPLLQGISDEAAAAKPNPIKWSKKEILGHLIDSASNNQHKFVRTMAQPQLHFVGYAQNHWVVAQHYASANWELLTTLWASYNLQLAHVIENTVPSVLHNTITIEGAGPFTLEFIMKDYAEHLKHHLLQILPDAELKSGFVNIYGV
ncbi:DinB family protein [Runella rosea]|uniref:DinB family protein n=1 Tax=Runella rosea TaxID=2259595 RepID=A0A344TQC4_9BACT|nr:DinB family protein [Runella rosea]AXE20845.1 DinB family protein [Runella rosea]